MASAGLEYLDVGPAEGTPQRGTLLLLHAFPLHAGMWQPQLDPAAAAGWRVVAPHWRGLHREEPPATSFDDMAASVADLASALGLETPVIGGVSMGGYLAFALLRRQPRFARGLVLCDTRAEADAADARAGRLAMAQKARDQGVAAIADDVIPRLLGATTRERRPEVVAEVRRLAMENRAEGVAGVVAAMMNRPDSTPQLATITCPTLILVGAEDTLTPPAMSEAMHARIPGSQLHVIDESGHLPNLERPELFNQALLAFLPGLR